MEPWLVEAGKQLPLTMAAAAGFVWVLKYVREIYEKHSTQLTGLALEHAKLISEIKEEHTVRIKEMSTAHIERLIEVTSRESDAAKAMIQVVGENNKALGSLSIFLSSKKDKSE